MGDNFDVGDDKPNTVNVRDKMTCVYMYVFIRNLSALFDNGFSLLLERLLRLDCRIPLKLGIRKFFHQIILQRPFRFTR